MPVNHRSNNRILPANSRAVDVAKRAIRDITPVQQRRYHNAFEVQGYEAVFYSRLNSGLKCSCQASRKVAASILNEDGKLPEGKINELMTGGLEFTINRYGSRRTGPHPSEADISRSDQLYGGHDNEKQTPFEIAGPARDLDDPFLDVTQENGANGPNQPFDIDDVATGFDFEVADLNGKACACCMGTGYVGGYEVLNGLRKVIAPHSPEVYSIQGEILANEKPHAFFGTQVTIDIVLPRGYVSLDAFKVWDNMKQVMTATVTIDSLPYSPDLLRALCDGLSHRFVISFDDRVRWTHLELQINLSTRSALIEFPRLQQGSNNTLADMTGNASVNLSPVIPRVATEDVFVESVFGKTFRVTSSNHWNDRDKNVHGWDCETVVAQPSEMITLLPRRRLMQQKSTNPVRDNQAGIRRT